MLGGTPGHSESTKLELPCRARRAQRFSQEPYSEVSSHEADFSEQSESKESQVQRLGHRLRQL